MMMDGVDSGIVILAKGAQSIGSVLYCLGK